MRVSDLRLGSDMWTPVLYGAGAIGSQAACPAIVQSGGSTWTSSWSTSVPGRTRPCTSADLSCIPTLSLILMVKWSVSVSDGFPSKRRFHTEGEPLATLIVSSRTAAVYLALLTRELFRRPKSSSRASPRRVRQQSASHRGNPAIDAQQGATKIRHHNGFRRLRRSASRPVHPS